MVGLSYSYGYGSDHSKNRTIGNPNKMAAIQDNMVAIFFKTDYHWKTKQRATIGIPNMLGIPAPNVLLLVIQSFRPSEKLFNLLLSYIADNVSVIRMSPK